MNDNSLESGHLTDEAATLALGGAFARAVAPGTVIYLEGELGAGKTTFTRGLMRGLGHQGRVKSPTYTLVESYPFGTLTVHHFDLYRMADPEEWEDAGFRELFDETSVCLVEWPDKAAGLVPPPDIVLSLVIDGDARRYHLHAITPIGHACLNRLSTPRAGA
ncbi:tRNA (adenosine(37)-N6)-threonylcarbamoyltransferase complex ATPase subunit type 1 TsaE [Crenobacter cavernae]|uniref:tRNA threonylcarbamoyladenosine biosynthesis protein TsaE n=1 Tax=Crenobacter cavernae TaxID=2290923 RepID=A0ABY0FE99_9NEIS|nr:tRNA (adenosine(37)-N6)-threonylcarbamoyltransferase complex ATPase subunit type 1 TsaE [Crenobacter cavernae]RXZ43557.1 tRNA (adenosine(37)-N6)-threonylcarbamoyltransferase complex ATPase subunit type 1 TsaE [Crenobacter cavernae]